MTEHPNVELARRGYEAFCQGDLPALSGLIADDVTWHVLGAGPLSGPTTAGTMSSVSSAGWPRRQQGRSGWIFTGVLANDEHAVVRCALSASRGVSRSRFRWRTSAMSAMARSPSSGPRQPTRRRPSISGPERGSRGRAFPTRRPFTAGYKPPRAGCRRPAAPGTALPSRATMDCGGPATATRKG